MIEVVGVQDDMLVVNHVAITLVQDEALEWMINRLNKVTDSLHFMEDVIAAKNEEMANLRGTIEDARDAGKDANP